MANDVLSKLNSKRFLTAKLRVALNKFEGYGSASRRSVEVLAFHTFDYTFHAALPSQNCIKFCFAT